MGSANRQIFGIGEAMRKEKKICPIWLLIAIMLFSQNVYAFNAFSTGYLRIIRDGLQLLILLYLIGQTIYRGLVEKNLIKAYLILVILIIAGMIFNFDFSGSYWILECTIAFLLINLYNYPNLLMKFETVMFYICSFYTVGYVIIRMNLSILNTSVYRLLEQLYIFHSHSGNLKFYMAGSTAIRSSAFYREPGVYQMFIICALVIELMARRPKRILHVFVYSVSVLVTYSTTGYICLFLVLLAGILSNWRTDKRFRKWVLRCGILIIPLLPKFLHIILNKFLATGANSHSWMSRSASVWTNLYFWLQNPLMGVGLKRILNNFEKITTDIFGIMSGGYSIKDDTNTVLLYFAAFGTIAGVVFLGGQFKCIKKLTNNRIMLLISLLALMFLYAGEAVNSTCLPYIIFFIGFSQIENTNSGQEKVRSRVELQKAKNKGTYD